MVDQSVMDSVEGEFEAVGDAEFIENIMQMVLNRLFADKKLFPDFAVAETLGYELYNFFLAVTEQRFLATLAGFRGLLKRVDHLGGHAIVEPDFSVENFPYAFHQQIAG